MQETDLLQKVKDLKGLKLMAEELNAEITQIENIIKAEMAAQNVDEMQVDIFKIRYVPVKTNRFDTTSFKKIYSDLYKQFSKVIETKRFSIV